MSLKRPIRRKSYLLLEVLISLGLVLLCLFPLLKPFIHIRKQSMIALDESRFERLAPLAFSEIKERLYEHHYSWDQLKKGVNDSLPPVTLVVKNKKTGKEEHKTFSRHFVIEKIERCYTDKTSQNNYIFLNLKVIFKNRFKESAPFISTLFAERKEKETT